MDSRAKEGPAGGRPRCERAVTPRWSPAEIARSASEPWSPTRPGAVPDQAWTLCRFVRRHSCRTATATESGRGVDPGIDALRVGTTIRRASASAITACDTRRVKAIRGESGRYAVWNTRIALTHRVNVIICAAGVRRRPARRAWRGPASAHGPSRRGPPCESVPRPASPRRTRPLGRIPAPAPGTAGEPGSAGPAPRRSTDECW
jgi:hypothetical protein